MLAIAEPLSTPRVNPTERAALERAEVGRPLMVSVRDCVVSKHGEKPRDVWLRMLLRVSDG